MTEREKRQETKELFTLYGALGWFYLAPAVAMLLGVVIGRLLPHKGN